MRMRSRSSASVSLGGIVGGRRSGATDVADHLDWRLGRGSAGPIAPRGRRVRLGADSGRVLGVLGLGLHDGRHLGGVHRSAVLARRLGHQQPLGRFLDGVPLGRPPRDGPFHVHAAQHGVYRARRHGLAPGEQHRIRHGGLVVGTGVGVTHRPGVQGSHHLHVKVLQRRHTRPAARLGRLVRRRPGLRPLELPGRVAVHGRPFVRHPLVERLQRVRFAFSDLHALGFGARPAKL